MSVKCEIDGPILRVTIIGAGGEELNGAILDAISSPNFTRGTSILFDVHRSDDNPTSERLRSRSQWLSALQVKGISSRVAVVVGARAFQYDIARIAAAHLEFQGMRLEIFTRMEEAEAWLSGGKPNPIDKP